MIKREGNSIKNHPHLLLIDRPYLVEVCLPKGALIKNIVTWTAIANPIHEKVILLSVERVMNYLISNKNNYFPPPRRKISDFISFVLLSWYYGKLSTSTKERKNQVADYSSIHSTLKIRPFQRSLRAALRFPYLNSLHFIRIIGDRRKKLIYFLKWKLA